MLRGAWKPIAAAAAVATPAYAYYASKSEKHQTFEAVVRVPGANGKSERVSKTFPLMPLNTVESWINENASSRSHTSPEGTSWKFTTASLASNDPIEDANASQIIHRDSTDPSAPGDYLFLAVMDGHSGRDTSQLLSKVLINAVALELNNLIKAPESTPSPGVMQRVKSLVWSSASKHNQTVLAANPTEVSRAIENAFVKLDTELVNAPIQVLANNLDQESIKKKTIPDLSKHPLALPTMLPAVSGSCAIMAVFDTAHRDLYVACTGDSRAVAGVWENTPDGKGQWRVEVLTEDQTGRNPNELARMQREHPADEANDVIRNGRVLGGLEPTRAFGDARYKWPREIQETLSQAFLLGNGRPLRSPPSLFRTPPYVTARPVVTHRKLSFGDDSAPAGDKALRFVVLATDGLWDELTSEEVVGLVGGHLTGLKGNIPKDELPNHVRTSTGTSTVDGKEQRTRDTSGSWAFKGENPSAHLIRNAFGGGNESILRQRLSIPAPYSRRFRDDITVTVVWWEEGKEKEANVITISDKLQAKL